MTDLVLLLIFLIFTVTAAIQIFYYFYFYLAVYTYKQPSVRSSPQPVSVIICARNEAENLSRFLPEVLRQDHPDFEVIVVNDCSDDDTYLVLGSLLKEYKNLKTTTIYKDPKFTHNKKLAQLVGIKAAKNEILLFTDADCRPESDKWLRNMVSHFEDSTTFVLGYGGYMKDKGLLNAYIRTDTANIAMQYLGMAIRGVPYMGVGRNLAYRRSEFFRVKGFGIHSNLASGDDDLFVNNNALGKNTRVEFSLPAHTRSVPSSTAAEWMTQKKRHLTTSPFYRKRDKILLITEPFSRLVYYITFMVLLASGYLWIHVLAIFGVRLVSQVTIYALVQKKLAEAGLVSYSLIFDILSPVINGILYLGTMGKRYRKTQWS
jgi:poly-beta-1,6-N-acetyl-D-glucosamine synthase